MRTAYPSHRVGDLPPIDSRLARAEVVPPDREDGGAALLHHRFGRITVGFARLLVAQDLDLQFVEERRAEHRVPRAVERSCPHERRTGVLERVLRAAVLEAFAGEVLLVVAQREAAAAPDLVIRLHQEDILVEPPFPALGLRRQCGDRRLGERIGRRVGRQIQEHGVGLGVPLSVVVEEEEVAVTADRTADRAAELVIVIRRLRPVVQLVDRVVRVQSLVSEELEHRSMKFVAARFRDDVDDRAAGSPVLGGERVGVHLELLHGILAELVGRAPRTGAADGLTEERVVVVGAVDDQAVQRAALAGEADVAGAHVAGHAGREQREVDEVATIDRQVLYGDLVDGRTGARTARLDDRRFPGDVDRLGEVGDPHLDAQRQRLADGERDPLLPARRKTRELRRERVDTDREDGGAEQPAFVGDRPAFGARRRLREIDGHARKRATRGVDDNAFDGAGGALRSGDRAAEEHE